MRVHPMAEQGPGLDGNDRRLVGPMLGELAPPVDQVVEQRRLVRPESREQHLVLRGAKDVEVVDLQQSELPDHPPHVGEPDTPARPAAVEALRRQRNSPRFGGGEIRLLLLRFKPRHRVSPQQSIRSSQQADSTVRSRQRKVKPARLSPAPPRAEYGRDRDVNRSARAGDSTRFRRPIPVARGSVA